MRVSDQLVGRFHQTGLSRWVRTSNLTRVPSELWWERHQTRRLFEALGDLPRQSPAETPKTNRPEIPSRRQVCEKMPGLVLAGEAFSEEMAQYCDTSKFQSITHHLGSCGYQDVYATVLKNLRHAKPRILEIGIGVNDPSAVSGMGAGHSPGASLLGWVGYFPGAEIHGADVDRRCLVDTTEYKTHLRRPA